MWTILYELRMYIFFYFIEDIHLLSTQDLKSPMLYGPYWASQEYEVTLTHLCYIAGRQRLRQDKRTLETS